MKENFLWLSHPYYDQEKEKMVVDKYEEDGSVVKYEVEPATKSLP